MDIDDEGILRNDDFYDHHQPMPKSGGYCARLTRHILKIVISGCIYMFCCTLCLIPPLIFGGISLGKLEACKNYTYYGLGYLFLMFFGFLMLIPYSLDNSQNNVPEGYKNINSSNVEHTSRSEVAADCTAHLLQGFLGLLWIAGILTLSVFLIKEFNSKTCVNATDSVSIVAYYMILCYFVINSIGILFSIVLFPCFFFCNIGKNFLRFANPEKV